MPGVRHIDQLLWEVGGGCLSHLSLITSFCGQ